MTVEVKVLTVVKVIDNGDSRGGGGEHDENGDCGGDDNCTTA